jgi:hypothetical protein
MTATDNSVVDGVLAPLQQGKLKINEVTGRETEVAQSSVVAQLKMGVSWGLISILAVATMAGALLAESLSTNAPKWYALFGERVLSFCGVLVSSAGEYWIDNQFDLR